MKKLLILLLFIPFVFSCSSDDSSDDTEPIGASTITFRVQEVWDKNTSWFNDTNIINDAININCDEDYIFIMPETNSDATGFETSLSFHHRDIDTLFIELFLNSQIPNPQWFDFNISNRFDVQRSPDKIGHIEFINFENNDKIRLDSALVNSGYGELPIIYFTSNKSEEFIDNITVKDFNCTPLNAFNKSTYSGYYLESTEFDVTVPFDELNSNLEVGDSIGASSASQSGWKPLGEGWYYPTFNADHKIVAKTVNN